jgi:peptidoglycan hydrolase CwlO-like protein
MGRRGAAAVLAFAIVISAATAAGARPTIDAAKHRAGSLAASVADARAQAAGLQTRVLALAAHIRAAQRSLDHVEARLLVAQRGFAAAQAELDAIRARLDERARAAFETLGPGASAVYLLGADSFGDLLDRTEMLGRMQEADAALAAEVRAKAARFATAKARLGTATAERGRLYARVASRQAELLAAFSAQQDALAVLVGEHRSAVEAVGRIERRVARETGALPFGDWADRFLGHLGAPTCRDNRVVVVAWQANEFTQARWNPLATTHAMPGSTSFNTVGVQNYRSLTQGVRASEQTLSGGAVSFGYAAILDDLHVCASAMTTAEAINASAWCRGCSSGSYVTELIPIVELYFDPYSILHV